MENHAISPGPSTLGCNCVHEVPFHDHVSTYWPEFGLQPVRPPVRRSVPVAASYANPAELRASGAAAVAICVQAYWVAVTTVDGEGVAVAVACGRGVGVVDGDVEPH